LRLKLEVFFKFDISFFSFVSLNQESGFSCVGLSLLVVNGPIHQVRSIKLDVLSLAYPSKEEIFNYKGSFSGVVFALLAGSPLFEETSSEEVSLWIDICYLFFFAE